MENTINCVPLFNGVEIHLGEKTRKSIILLHPQTSSPGDGFKKLCRFGYIFIIRIPKVYILWSRPGEAIAGPEYRFYYVAGEKNISQLFDRR